jgi:hypothetical protein
MNKQKLIDQIWKEFDEGAIPKMFCVKGIDPKDAGAIAGLIFTIVALKIEEAK